MKDLRITSIWTYPNEPGKVHYSVANSTGTRRLIAKADEALGQWLLAQKDAK